MKDSTFFDRIKNRYPTVPEYEINIILAYVLKNTKNSILTRANINLNLQQIKDFEKILQQRQKNIPLQYILKVAFFYNHEFSVGKGVLIPRPETEILVEYILSYIKDNFTSKQSISIADLCTGSGAIALSLDKELEKKYTNYKITASDISTNALHYTFDNALKLNASNTKIIYSDLLTNFSVKQKFDIISINPPYITENLYKKLNEEVKEFEPKIALTAQDKGLYIIKQFFFQTKKLKKLPKLIICEISHEQKSPLQQYLEQQNLSPQFLQDYNNKNRFVIVKQ